LWFHGPTRTGKTWAAIEEAGEDPNKISNNLYIKNSHTKWFDGYNREKSIIIDELPKEANCWIANYLKKWADKYPV